MAACPSVEDCVGNFQDLPYFLCAEPSARDWLSKLISRLRDKRCGREELAWLLHVPVSALSEALPPSAGSELLGRSLLDVGFLPQGSACRVAGCAAWSHLNGRRCVLSRNLQDGASYAHVTVDVGIRELPQCQEDGGPLKPIQIARKNLEFLAAPEAFSTRETHGLELEPPTQHFQGDILPEEGAGSELPATLLDQQGQDWLATLVGRLVDSKACGREELAYLLGLSPRRGFGGEAVPSSLGQGHVGWTLDEMAFVPALVVCLVQDCDVRADLNWNLARLSEPCADGHACAQVAMLGSGEALQMARGHLRLLPLSGSLAELGSDPGVPEKCADGADLGGASAILPGDCPSSTPRAEAAGQGARAVPEPAATAEGAQDGAPGRRSRWRLAAELDRVSFARSGVSSRFDPAAVARRSADGAGAPSAEESARSSLQATTGTADAERGSADSSGLWGLLACTPSSCGSRCCVRQRQELPLGEGLDGGFRSLEHFSFDEEEVHPSISDPMAAAAQPRTSKAVAEKPTNLLKFEAFAEPPAAAEDPPAAAGAWERSATAATLLGDAGPIFDGMEGAVAAAPNGDFGAAPCLSAPRPPRPYVPPLRLTPSLVGPGYTASAKPCLGVVGSLKRLMAATQLGRLTRAPKDRPAKPAQELPRQLREIAQLRAEGALTDAEFHAAKTKLLRV